MLVSQLRLPRILVDFMVGSGMAVTGLVFQTYFRNPLAEPFILGVSGGAAFGVVLHMAFFSFLPIPQPVFAFVFALITVLFVYRLSGKFFQINVGALILIGVGFNFLYSSMITIAHTLFSARFSKNVLLWYFGDTGNNSLNVSVTALAFVSILSLVLYYDSARLNIYQLGDSVTVNSGVNIKNMTRRIYLIGSLITAVTVALCGTIGFVGIVVPHLVKGVIGSDHRVNMVVSFFCGGILVVVIDTFFKTVFFPSEVPIGAVTALVGTPFFIYILKRAVNR
jgi:iron complex transport system permease protein